MEQFRCPFSIHNLQPFFFESRNDGIRGRDRICFARHRRRSIGYCPSNRKRFAVEIILGQSQSAWGKSVRTECDDCTDCCYN
jgi:hypothetical protein